MTPPVQGPVPNFAWKELRVTSVDANPLAFTAIPTDCYKAHIQNQSDTDVTIGPTTPPTARLIPSGQEFSLESAQRSFDLRGWYLQTSAGGKTLSILYCEAT
jgi:hypothetical protein